LIKITDGAAELKFVKTRKEGKGEDRKILGLDMQFVCTTKAKGVTPDILGSPAQVFWQTGKEKEALFLGLATCTSKSKVKNATLQFAGIVFENEITLSNWKFTPRAHGMIDLSFKASVEDPTIDQRSIITKCTKSGRLEVEGELDLIDQMESDENESGDQQENLGLH